MTQPASALRDASLSAKRRSAASSISVHAPSGSRCALVFELIRERIAGRVLVAGDRLPSLRAMAQHLSVAPATVVDAYDRLVTEGIVRSHPGSGFFVTGAAPSFAPAAVAAAKRAVDPFWVSRQALEAGQQTLRLGCGWLPPSMMPQVPIRRALRRLGRADEAMLAEYGSPRGSLTLRRRLARTFAVEGLPVDPDQILLTASGTQAIDLVCRLLLRPGDPVLVDDPGYFNFQALLRVHRAEIIGVPMTSTGPDVAAFEAIVAARRPRLYLTNSAIQNPTGATLGPDVARSLLLIAAAHDLVIVEDDIFAELEPEPSTRLAVLDGLARVVRIGSFSKTISASVRCGYVAARGDWIEDLIDIQVASNFGGPSPLAAALVHDVLGDSDYRRHLIALRYALDDLRVQIGAQLEELRVRLWLQPRGGFFLWCRLPEGLDAGEMAKSAQQDGVVLAPGAAFSPSRESAAFMRFNVAQMQDPRAIDIVARALKRI
jgi:DNA-binding transcriptional MocR family regulator